MSETGIVYIGFDVSGLFKIGITNDKKKRLKQFRTSNPYFVYLFTFLVENPAVKEIELHTKFGESRERGEWFWLSPEDLKWIYDHFTGDKSRHSLEDFEIIHDQIVNKRSAYRYTNKTYMEEMGCGDLYE